MKYARISLYYPAAYWVMTGVNLLAAPELSMRLLLSTGHYGTAMPRMAGALALALGIVVVQIIRHRVDSLYPTLIGARVMLCTVWAWLFFQTSDPFFLVVFGVVAAGMVWTAVAYLRDHRQSLLLMAP